MKQKRKTERKKMEERQKQKEKKMCVKAYSTQHIHLKQVKV